MKKTPKTSVKSRTRAANMFLTFVESDPRKTRDIREAKASLKSLTKQERSRVATYIASKSLYTLDGLNRAINRL